MGCGAFDMSRDQDKNPPTLLSFGHGYSAHALARLLVAQGWRVYGTTRCSEKAQTPNDQGVTPILWGEDISRPLSEATHILISAAPNETGDPVLTTYGDVLRAYLKPGVWVGYLSTTGVYGDHQGAWVDESTPLTPSTKRGQMRVTAEAAWAKFTQEADAALHVFRLAGIYGPGRGPFAKVRQGTARRIIKQGQVFSRIHVADIAQCLAASIAHPQLSAIYNLCDDDPAPPEDVIAYAATLLGLPLPPAEDFATAEMTPMARSFYAESKRVRNDKIKTELGIKLIYPNYKEGLKALLKEGE